jgi:hypothetical protein
MKSLRSLVLVAPLLLSFALAGCSDDESTTGAAQDDAPVEETERGCEAKVKVTGDVKTKWKAEGLTILQDGSQAFYKTTDKKFALSVFPAREDTPAVAVFTVKDDSYTTQDDSGTVEADPEGSGAEVKATATGVQPGSSVKVKATITCDA